MTDSVLWISAVVIVVVFTAVVWLNRRRMKAEVERARGGNPDFRVLAEELRRSNDILEKTLASHEERLRALEHGGRTADAGGRPRSPASLN